MNDDKYVSLDYIKTNQNIKIENSVKPNCLFSYDKLHLGSIKLLDKERAIWERE